MPALRDHFASHWRTQEWYPDVHLAPHQPVFAREYINDYGHFVGLTGGTWLLARMPWWRKTAACLSADFATRAIDLDYENTGDTLSYRLYEHGELREEFAHSIQEERFWFSSSWRPGVQPSGDEEHFVDATFHELGLRLPYAWLQRFPDGRFFGRAGFDLDFSGQSELERLRPVFPPVRVPGELSPEKIAGFDVAVLAHRDGP